MKRPPQTDLFRDGAEQFNLSSGPERDDPARLLREKLAKVAALEAQNDNSPVFEGWINDR